MARGKPWTDEELALLKELAEQGLSAQEIYDSGKLPERTYEAIRKQLNLGCIVATKHTAIVETIEPAEDALSIEEVVKLFSTAFKQICGLQQADKLTLERFRIIFQAAKDYGPLLKFYENWEAMEQRVENVEAILAELQARKTGQKS